MELSRFKGQFRVHNRNSGSSFVDFRHDNQDPIPHNEKTVTIVIMGPTRISLNEIDPAYEVVRFNVIKRTTHKT